jgi:outer membrane protein insertion porin family
VRIGFPLTADAFMTMRYVLRQDEVQVPDYFCDPSQQQVSQTLCDQRGRYTTSLLGYQVTLDRRNDPVRPTRGYFVSLAQDLAGLGGDVNYLRSELEGGWYYGFNKDFVLSLSGSAGYVTGWGDDVVRINDRFYKGGNSFRGFRVAGIGPRDISFGRSDALGGEAFAIGSAELTVPTFIPQQYGIRASLFTDVGTLGILDDAIKTGSDGLPLPGVVDDLSLRASAGLSVFWRSPMGPIRFDFSQILQREDYDRVETFRFSQTTKF